MDSTQSINIPAIVFLDRDGTINVDSGYVVSPEQVRLIDGAAQSIALIRNHGFSVVVVTNQSAVGYGMASLEDIEATNEEVRSQLKEENPQALIDAILFCPHLPQNGCECRKPKIGMVSHIVKQSNFQTEGCWIVGDKLSDLEFGKNLGILPMQRILVLTGHGQSALAEAKISWPGEIFQVCETLKDAAVIIVKKEP